MLLLDSVHRLVGPRLEPSTCEALISIVRCGDGESLREVSIPTRKQLTALQDGFCNFVAGSPWVCLQILMDDIVPRRDTCSMQSHSLGSRGEKMCRRPCGTGTPAEVLMSFGLEFF